MSKKNGKPKFDLPTGFEQTRSGRTVTFPIQAWKDEVNSNGKLVIPIYHDSKTKREGAFTSLGVRKALKGLSLRYSYGMIDGKPIMLVARKDYANAFPELKWKVF